MARQLGGSAAALLGGTRALLSPRGLRGAALELAWSTTHVALYPWGVLQRTRYSDSREFSLGDLPLAKRCLVGGHVESARTPILLVHGMVDNQSIFAPLRRQLERRGFGSVVGLNYSPLSADVRLVASRLEQLVEHVCADTGYDQVHVVGHSLGGMVGRYYVQRMGGDARVQTLVTLGTPHNGTTAAYLLPHPLGRQLRPGSDLIDELALPAPDCRTRVLSVWSDNDQLVLPRSSASLEHPDLDVHNVQVSGVGHMSMPIDGRVVHEITKALTPAVTSTGTSAAG